MYTDLELSNGVPCAESGARATTPSARTIDSSGVVAILDTVAGGGVRLPEIRRPRCFTPLATGGLVHLRGEGDVRRLMLHSQLVEGLEPCDIPR